MTLGAANPPAGSEQIDLVTESGIQGSAIVSGTLWASSQAQIRQMAAAKGFQVNAYVAAPGDSGTPVNTLDQASAWISTVAQGPTAAATAPVAAAVAAPTTADTTGNAVIGGVVGLVGGAGLGAVLGGGRWTWAGALVGLAAGVAVGATARGWTD